MPAPAPAAGLACCRHCGSQNRTIHFYRSSIWLFIVLINFFTRDVPALKFVRAIPQLGGAPRLRSHESQVLPARLFEDQGRFLDGVSCLAGFSFITVLLPLSLRMYKGIEELQRFLSLKTCPASQDLLSGRRRSYRPAPGIHPRLILSASPAAHLASGQNAG